MPVTDPSLFRERLAPHRWGLLGQQGYVLGIDMGGYGLRVLLVDLQNQTIASDCTEVQQEDLRDPQRVLQDTVALAQRLLAQHRVPVHHLVRIGVGFGAPLDRHRGIVLASPRLPEWEQVAIKDFFEQELDTTTLVGNDANLIARSEATFGVGYGCNHLLYLHLSSGVGAGMVLDGRLYYGYSGIAGEIGHAGACPVPYAPPSATLEDLVSVRGLLRRAESLGLSTTDLGDLFGADPIGHQVIQEAISLLGLHLAHLVTLLNPQMVVLGGIVVRVGGDRFVAAIEQRVRQSIAPTLAPLTQVRIVPATLGADSIAMGAIALALESLSE